MEKENWTVFELQGTCPASFVGGKTPHIALGYIKYHIVILYTLSSHMFAIEKDQDWVCSRAFIYHHIYVCKYVNSTKQKLFTLIDSWFLMTLNIDAKGTSSNVCKHHCVARPKIWTTPIPRLFSVLKFSETGSSTFSVTNCYNTSSNIIKK